jgi:hypothetical protein
MFAEWTDLDLRTLLWNTNQKERETRRLIKEASVLLYWERSGPQGLSPWEHAGVGGGGGGGGGGDDDDDYWKRRLSRLVQR